MGPHNVGDRSVNADIDCFWMITIIVMMVMIKWTTDLSKIIYEAFFSIQNITTKGQFVGFAPYTPLNFLSSPCSNFIILQLAVNLLFFYE